VKRALIGVVAAALALASAACGSSSKPASAPTTQASGSTLPGKPKNATVVLLTHDAFAVSKNVLADFTKQTGYKVKLVQPGDAGLMVNQAILRKNNPLGDAIFGVDNTFLTRALNAGIFEAYTPPGTNTLKAGVYVDPSHDVTPIDEGDVCVVDDTAWFGHNGRPPAPTDLASLIDPRYKNMLVVENPATSSPGLAFLQATVAAYGVNGWQGYWSKLKANGVRVVDDWTSAYDTDFTAGGGTSGDRPIVVSYGSDPAADVVNSSPHHDTPHVGVLVSTCFRQFEFAGVLHNAKNPAGAQALISFMLTREFQEDMPLQMYVNPVTTDAQVPAVYAKWAVIPPNPYTITPQQIGANRDSWIKEWNDLVVG
jgi:thiamine transport system substrate-binding protein